MDGSSGALHLVRPSHHVLSVAKAADVRQKAEAAVLGALVGDAACLPLHWRYSPEEITAVVAGHADAPEFLADAPNKWHPLKKPGDLTMYGEQLVAMVRSLREKNGWNAVAFGRAFYEAFGPGGRYVGYVDSATKGTVLNLLLTQAELDAVMHVSLGEVPAGEVTAVSAARGALRGLAEEFSGAALAGKAVELARAALTSGGGGAASAGLSTVAVDLLTAAAGKVDELAARYAGSSDNQSNVLAKLPAIVARYAGHRELLHVVVESTKATSNNEEAISWTTWAARVLEAAVLGASARDAITSNLPHLEQPFRAAVEHAIHLAGEGGDVVAGVRSLRINCVLASVVPASVFLALSHGGAPSYAAAMRDNMLAGGDSCGRAVFLGALLAAVNAGTAAPPGAGLPDAWLARLGCGAEMVDLVRHIHVPVTATGGAAADHVELVRSARRDDAAAAAASFACSAEAAAALAAAAPAPAS